MYSKQPVGSNVEPLTTLHVLLNTAQTHFKKCDVTLLLQSSDCTQASPVGAAEVDGRGQAAPPGDEA